MNYFTGREALVVREDTGSLTGRTSWPGLEATWICAKVDMSRVGWEGRWAGEVWLVQGRGSGGMEGRWAGEVEWTGCQNSLGVGGGGT